MSHKRTDIRNALVSLLKGTAPGYATLAGAKVYPNRVRAISASSLPAIVVYDEQESNVTTDIRQQVNLRRLSMKLDLLVKGNDGYDVLLDDLAKQVEDLIRANPQLSGTTMSIVYQTTEFTFEAAEENIGRATLTYEITYR